MMDNDSILDKKLKETLSDNSVWNGSPDKLWSEIKPKVEKPVSKRQRIRVWTSALTAVLLIVGIFYYKPWLAEPKAPRGSIPNSTGAADFADRNAAIENKGYDSTSIGKHPAPHLVDFTIIPGNTQVSPGQKFDVQINITARTGSLNFGGTPPVVRMWKWGVPWDKPLKEAQIPELQIKMPATSDNPLRELEISKGSAKDLKADETASATVSFDAPLEPGWYAFDMEFKIKSGATVSTISGNAVRFFVKYPDNSTRSGDFVVNKSIESAGHTVELNSISMSDNETKVEFKVSNTSVPAGFVVRLTANDGTFIPMLEQSQKELQSGNIVTAIFGPVLKSSSKLSFEVKDIDELTKDGVKPNPGPWIIEIPLQ